MITFNVFYIRYLRSLSILSILLTGVGFLGSLINRDTPNLPLLGAFLVANVVWLTLIDRGRLQFAAYGLVISLLVATALTPLNERLLLLGVLALTTAALTTRTEMFVVANAVVFAKVLVASLPLLTIVNGQVPPEVTTVGITIGVLAFVSIIARFFSNTGRQAIRASESYADLIESASAVTQPIAQAADRSALFNQAVTLIQEKFRHYHVQIFIVNDTRDQAVLVASTGEPGRQLLERGHQLSVGSQSVIGQVILRGAPVLVSDTRRASVYYPNELLGRTRAELALPIRDGAQTIGALDLQSLTPDSFSRAEVSALQMIADVLASVLRGIRLREDQARIQNTNDQLRQQVITSTSEIARLNQQLTRVSWQEYQSERRGVTGITLERDQVMPSNQWTEPLLRAGQEARVIQTGSDAGTVAVPVTLRGEVIGAIEVDAGAEANPETVEMVQAVAQRLALSLENARLYEATLEAAAHEQRINDIAARFQSVATVDELMRIALAELGDILGAEHGAIRLGQFATEEQP